MDVRLSMMVKGTVMNTHIVRNLAVLAASLAFLLSAGPVFAVEPNRLSTEPGTSVPRPVVKKRGHIRIATLGPRSPSVAGTAEPQAVVGQVIAHWRREFSQVLPDRPDLIVVPEACDRVGGLSRERLLEYYRVRKDQIDRKSVV